MIISVSRRTDIPAFYSDWFFNRIDKGYLYVVNPMNCKQVSEIRLNRSTVDCFVFWTKNPEPMLNKLHILDEKGFSYYFQFTLTAYDQDIEPVFHNKNDLVKTFRQLAKQIGKEKVVWRYDPILLNEKYTKEFHYKWFEKLCMSLCGYTQLCVISFLDLYVKIRKNINKLYITEIQENDMIEIGKRFSQIARKYNIIIETCSEKVDLSKYGINKGKCIDDKLISNIIGKAIDVKKDDTQRESCGCVKSIDVGQYNTCKHFCAYCYANFSRGSVEENCKKHDVNSELLAGTLQGDEKITVREMKSIVSDKDCEQLEFNFQYKKRDS